MSQIRLIFVLWLLFWNALSGLTKRSIVIWVDNEDGAKTKIELSPVQGDMLRDFLLEMLGLQYPPPHRRQSREIKTNGSAPNFLRNIYDALDDKGRAHALAPEYNWRVGAANTIITFVNQSKFFVVIVCDM